jgi:hypothetical protein
MNIRACTILFIILLLSVSTRAQDSRTFRLHASLGLNGCQIHGDNYSGYDKIGLFAGLSVRAKLSEKASAELGFYFSQKGSRHNSNPKINDYTYYRVHLNYIDLQPIFRYQLTQKYFITGGPSVAYLISYTEENEFGDWSGVYPFEKFEVGVNIGLGAKLNDKWTVEVRSGNSVTPIRSYGVLANKVYYPNAVARFFNKGLYNNILTLLFTFQFDKKKSE